MVEPVLLTTKVQNKNSLVPVHLFDIRSHTTVHTKKRKKLSKVFEKKNTADLKSDHN